MSKNEKDQQRECADRESAGAELAANALMFELLRTGRILTYIADILVEWVDETDFSGRRAESVVIRRFCDLVVPELTKGEKAQSLWNLAALIETVRDRIVTDFQRELDAGRGRSQTSDSTRNSGE